MRHRNVSTLSKIRVLRLHGLAARLLPLQQPPYASRPRRRPRGVHGASDADDGVVGATRSCDRRLVGPVIPTTATLVVAVAPLLVALARGGAFAIGRAVHAAPGPGAEVPEDLDGEEIALHQLKMEGEPLRQAVDAGERLPPSTKIHHAGGWGLDVDSRTTDPTAPHAQSQRLGLFHLHHACEGRRETEAATRRPAQPDEELAGVVPDVDRREKRSRWRRRGRRVAPSASSTTSPRPPRPRPRPLPLSLAAGSTAAGARGGGARCLAATLAATDEGPGFPFSMASGERGSEDEEEEEMEECGFPSPPLLLLIKKQGGDSTAPLNQSGRREARRPGPACCLDPRRPSFLPPPPATPGTWKPRG